MARAQSDFPAPGGPFISRVVVAGRGHFQRPLDVFLALDVGEVNLPVHQRRCARLMRWPFVRRNLLQAVDMFDQLTQRLRPG